MDVGSQERILQRVFGVFLILRNAARNTENLFRMSPPDLFKYRGVATGTCRGRGIGDPKLAVVSAKGWVTRFDSGR